MKAHTLTEVLNLFDPREPLSGSKMDVYLRKIKKPTKLLFTGHRGSGKSTELFRLISLLEDEFFIVHFSVLEALNPFDVTYVDLLLALATRLLAQATDAKIIKKRGLALLKEELLDEIYRWFTREVLGDIPFVAPRPDAEVSVKVNLLAVQLESKVGTEAASRKQIRERLELRLSELLDWMNYAIDQVARATKQGVLLIVEDIDKLDLARARDFFLEHATSLTTPKAYVVYTFPVSLRYSNDFVQIIRNFDEAFVLPNIKVFDRDGTPYEPGRERLREVLTKRMNEDLIEEEALEKLIENSGGLMVTLIELVPGLWTKPRGDQKPVFSLQIAVHVDLKQVDSVRFR